MSLQLTGSVVGRVALTMLWRQDSLKAEGESSKKGGHKLGKMKV